jgi:hypothetical protein
MQVVAIFTKKVAAKMVLKKSFGKFCYINLRSCIDYIFIFYFFKITSVEFQFANMQTFTNTWS